MENLTTMSGLQLSMTALMGIPVYSYRLLSLPITPPLTIPFGSLNHYILSVPVIVLTS